MGGVLTHETEQSYGHAPSQRDQVVQVYQVGSRQSAVSSWINDNTQAKDDWTTSWIGVTPS